VPPGHYTLDYVVVDALNHQAGSGSQPIDVNSVAPSTPVASSLAIVRQIETLPAGQQDRKNPLQIEGVLLSPNVAGPLHKASDATLTFFYTAYPADRPLSATFELTDGNSTLAKTPLRLPPPDKSGRIQHLARLPLANIPPGSYEVRITLTDGLQPITRTAAFVLAP
jgi:hypothetical protein